MVLSPFSFVGTLPEAPVGGDQTVDLLDDESGKTFRYHIFTEHKTSQLYWYNVNADVEVVAIAGGANGDDSSYDANGVGGLGGEYRYVAATPITSEYQILSVRPGGVGEDSFIRLPGEVVTLAAASDEGEAHALPSGFAEALNATHVGGKGADAVGPVNATTLGGGGGGGFKLKEPYPQESYPYTYTTGGPYTYDCSYGASGSPIYDTRTVTGDCQAPQCPATWYVCYGDCNTGEVTCCHPDGRVMGGWWNGCPGGWSTCSGARCCTTETYQSGTSYSCPNGGTVSGSTCSKTCTGDNTQTITETRWTDCVSGMSPVNRVCTDTRPTGGGQGDGGVIVLRYELAATRGLQPVTGTGVPIIY